MIRRILLFAATSTLLWSCNSETTETDTNTSVETTQQKAAVSDTGSNTLTEAIQAKDGAVVAPTTEAAGAKGNAAVKLNPAHGQPGHDCNLPVGAPLTASAAPAAAPQPAQSVPMNQGAPAQQLLPDGSVNPPHGQPGHVCM